MKWITRERVKVDRVACPWLIRKFIDPQAEFLFVPADTVMQTAEREGAIPFDVPNVEFGHHGPECSFDALVKKHGLARDPAFWRMALCVCTSQLAAVSLGTLWVATWLRDVMGYAPAGVAQALLLFNLAMIAGYLGFGRASDRLTRAGRGTLPLMAGGIAVASCCLLLIALGVRWGHLALWSLFFGCATAGVLSFEGPVGNQQFSLAEMQKRLPKPIFKSLKKTIESGAKLDANAADVVATAMKEWAIEKGATHYAHVFYPLTGLTAEKHDSFLSPTPDGRAIAEELWPSTATP